MSQTTINKTAYTYELDPGASLTRPVSGEPVKIPPAAVETPLPAAQAIAPQKTIVAFKELAGNTPEAGLRELEGALEKLKQRNPDIDVCLSDYSDILKYIGSILIKNADAMRQSALNDRMVAREAARGSLLGQSAKLQEAANDQRRLAYITLAATVMVSGISIAASAFALRNSLQVLKVGQQETKDLALNDTTLKGLKSLQTDAADDENGRLVAAAIAERQAAAANISRTAAFTVQQLNTSTQKATLINEAGNAGTNATRSFEATAHGAIKVIEAEGVLDAANAQYEQQQADVKKELYDKVIDLIQQSINMYRDMLNSQAEAMRAITRA